MWPREFRSSLRGGAIEFAPFIDLRFDRIADFPDFFKFLIGRSRKTGGVRKAPMEPFRTAWKNRTALRARLVANGNYPVKFPGGIDKIRRCFRLIFRNINSDFCHHFHDDRVQFPRFQPRAVNLEIVPANVLQKSFRHLAAGAVVNANKQNALFHKSFAPELAELVVGGREQHPVSRNAQQAGTASTAPTIGARM